MINILIGFLMCWILIGIFAQIAMMCNCLDSQGSLIVIALPLYVLASPFLLLYIILWPLKYSFQYLLVPMELELFTKIIKYNPQYKAVQITDKVYKCINQDSVPIWKKMVFVRTIKNNDTEKE